MGKKKPLRDRRIFGIAGASSGGGAGTGRKAAWPGSGGMAQTRASLPVTTSEGWAAVGGGTRKKRAAVAATGAGERATSHRRIGDGGRAPAPGTRKKRGRPRGSAAGVCRPGATRHPPHRTFGTAVAAETGSPEIGSNDATAYPAIGFRNAHHN